MSDAQTSSVPGGPEGEALASVLGRNRRTFAWKTEGLDATGMSARTAATSMTLGGLPVRTRTGGPSWTGWRSPL